MAFYGHRILISDDEKVLEIDDGWIKQMYLMPLKSTLKMVILCYIYFTTIKSIKVTIYIL